MSDNLYPIIVVPKVSTKSNHLKELESRPGIRERVIIPSLYSFTLTTEIVRSLRGHIFEYLAEHIPWMDDPKLWWVIADCNKVRHPADWKVGDVIQVPTSIGTIRLPKIKRRPYAI